MATEQPNNNGGSPAKKWNMKETLRHIEAFEYYYSLGAKRSLVEVGQKFGVSQQSVEKWSVAFGWQKRVQERDQKNAQALAQQTDKLILKTRADYRREIQDSLKIIRAALTTVVQGLTGKKIKAKNIADIDRLIGAQDKIVRLDLLLMGEIDPDSGETVKMVRFSFEPPKNRTGQGPDNGAGQTPAT